MYYQNWSKGLVPGWTAPRHLRMAAFLTLGGKRFGLPNARRHRDTVPVPWWWARKYQPPSYPPLGRELGRPTGLGLLLELSRGPHCWPRGPAWHPTALRLPGSYTDLQGPARREKTGKLDYCANNERIVSGLLFTLLSGRENKSSNWSTPISTIYPRLHI